MPNVPTPDRLPRTVRFARPGKLPPTTSLPGRVAVLDLAINGHDPEPDLRWIEDLGERLAVWIDHHDQDIWQQLADRPVFVLIPRSEAPACPPLVTAERVQRFGPVDCLLAHGDLDGILSAAKWILLEEGLPCPEWIDPDGIAADTRKGEMTARGARLDRALRALSGRDRARRAIIASVLSEALGLEEHEDVRTLLDRGAEQHERIQTNTRRLAERALPIEDVEDNAVLLDLRRLPGNYRIDVTQLMLTLQAEHDLVVVLGRYAGGGLKIIVGTDPARSGLDLRREFDIQGFAPFRVHVPPDKFFARLPSGFVRARIR